jgi:hypothetical protein
MPPIQDLSIASPQVKPNPFSAFRVSLNPPATLHPSVQPALIADFGRPSLHPPAFGHTRIGASTAGLQVPQQETPMKKTYVFSAAEIRTLVATRGSDEGSGPHKLVFYLDWSVIKGITKWRNFKADQG